MRHESKAPTGSRLARRLAVILLLGGVAVCVALVYRRGQLPQPAPAQVQRSGMDIIQRELTKIADSSFGRSERGQALISEIEKLVESDLIVFSSGLGSPRGLTWYSVFGTKRVYVKVIEMNYGRYLHQLPWQVSEVLFHEALHSLRASLHCSSFEEECDAFAAGFQAEAASRGITPGNVFSMDGMPIAEFVKLSYPGIRNDTGYRPVGESLEWLMRHVRSRQDNRRENDKIFQSHPPDSINAADDLTNSTKE